MRVSFLVQQCLYGIAIVNAAEKVDWGGFEFGREALLDDFSDAEVRYRDLIESDILFMSMSMSFDYHTAPPTPSPSTKQPTAEVQGSAPAPVSPEPVTPPPSSLSRSRIGCDEQFQTAVSLKLDVDTAIGKTAFSDDLIQALNNALSAEYSFCSSRRLGERYLDNQDYMLGEIAILETSDESCSPQSIVASECHVVVAELIVSGEDEDVASSRLRNSLVSILENDQAFDDELYMNGIVDVRLKESTGETALNSPLRSGESQLPARPAVVAVLSVAAGTVVVAAIVLRKFGLGSRAADKEGTDSDSDSYDETVPVTMSGSTMV